MDASDNKRGMAIADDVDCAGRVWDFLGEPDKELEEEVVEIIEGPSYPIGSLWTDDHYNRWGRELAENEPGLHATHSIGSQRGLRLIWLVDRTKRALNFKTIFAVGTFKERFTFEIDRIETTPDGVQARAVGSLVGPEDAASFLSFYITDWYESRQLIQPGDTHVFGIGIWAMHIRSAEPMRWEMPTPEWMKSFPETKAMAEKETVTIIGDELRTLLAPHPKEGPADQAWFRGKVLSSRKLRAELVGWPMWDLLVEVLDLNDEPIRMTIVVTEAVLGEAPIPRRGQWVEGYGWVQGNLLDFGTRPAASQS